MSRAVTIRRDPELWHKGYFLAQRRNWLGWVAWEYRDKDLRLVRMQAHCEGLSYGLLVDDWTVGARRSSPLSSVCVQP